MGLVKAETRCVYVCSEWKKNKRKLREMKCLKNAECSPPLPRPSPYAAHVSPKATGWAAEVVAGDQRLRREGDDLPCGGTPPLAGDPVGPPLDRGFPDRQIAKRSVIQGCETNQKQYKQ